MCEEEVWYGEQPRAITKNTCGGIYKSFYGEEMTPLLSYQWAHSERSEREAAVDVQGWAGHGRAAPSQCCSNRHTWHSIHSHWPPGPPHGTSYCQLKKQKLEVKPGCLIPHLCKYSISVPELCHKEKSLESRDDKDDSTYTTVLKKK